MPTFEVLVGCHIGNGEKRLEAVPGMPTPTWQGGYKDKMYKRGDLVQCEEDLVKKFGSEKFRKLDDREAGYRTDDQGRQLKALAEEAERLQVQLDEARGKLLRAQQSPVSVPEGEQTPTNVDPLSPTPNIPLSSPQQEARRTTRSR